MEVLRPLNLLPYNKEEAIRVLEKDYGVALLAANTRITGPVSFRAYYLPHKFGYDKRKAHLSSLIVSGQMSRGDALEALKTPLYDAEAPGGETRYSSLKSSACRLYEFSMPWSIDQCIISASSPTTSVSETWL